MIEYSDEDSEKVKAALEALYPPMEKEDSLGDRMKNYEHAVRTYLPPKMPVILRVDGRAFHTYTKGLKAPFDDGMIEAMDDVAVKLCEEISGAQLAYVQSDEISVFIADYKHEKTQAWFGGNVQKMTSISAAIASVEMTLASGQLFHPGNQNVEPGDLRPATFDSRVFVMPREDVVNYFVWRQQDWVRNSLQMLSRSLYSHKELVGKNQADMHEMCFQKGHNWNDLPVRYKRGRCIVKRSQSVHIPAGPNAGTTIFRPKWVVDIEIPTFTKDRKYIGDLV